MSNLVKSPYEELIEALSDISDLDHLNARWFRLGQCIYSDYIDIFEAPHIEWNIIAPHSLKSTHYTALRNAFENVISDRFRSEQNDNELSIDLVEESGLWKFLPPLATALMEAVKNEVLN